MPTHDDMARFSYARDESTLASPRLCISRGDSINCSGFGPEANGWLLRLPPVLQTLHGFSMPPIALTPMLDKLADTSMGAITHASLAWCKSWEGRPRREAFGGKQILGFAERATCNEWLTAKYEIDRPQ